MRVQGIDMPDAKISSRVLRRILKELAHSKLPDIDGTPRYYRNIETVLGTLRVDVRNLLMLTAQFYPWPLFKYKLKPVEITDEIVDGALAIVHRLPFYIWEDFNGIALEENFASFFKDSRTTPSWTEVATILNDTKRRVINLRALRHILSHLGVNALRIDEVRAALTILFDSDGALGSQAWKKLVHERLQLAKRRGRPRKAAYDQLYQKRVSSSANASYGKLIRELAEFQSVPVEILRNRAKASVSYRKRKKSPTLHAPSEKY